ncbi:MAG: hypothetical protein Q7U34_13770 [Anaerolineales bacterium]|nr:hypothetical protein [Anaerolineales bacterium]
MKDDTTAKSKLINAKTRRRQEKQNLFQKKKTKPKGVSMDFLEVELKILCGFAPLR